VFRVARMTTSTVAVWSSQKTVLLTGHQRHRHTPGLVAPTFQAPSPVAHIAFGPTALAAAIARTATLWDAPPDLLSRLKDSAMNDAEILIADGPVFELSPYPSSLNDNERTHFAARAGAGITDLYMNALGYVWRDNAVCLALTLNPHADFLYAGGSVIGHGVVLAEAHGSFAAGVTDEKIAGEARRKYLRQVRPYIADPSPHGQVVHGYSLAFGSRPGTTGAFLCLSETQRPKIPRSPSTPPQLPAAVGGATYTQIALSSHRSNFVLMDALSVADWIDWTRGARNPPSDTDPVAFFPTGMTARTRSRSRPSTRRSSGLTISSTFRYVAAGCGVFQKCPRSYGGSSSRRKPASGSSHMRPARYLRRTCPRKALAHSQRRLASPRDRL